MAQVDNINTVCMPYSCKGAQSNIMLQVQERFVNILQFYMYVLDCQQ